MRVPYAALRDRVTIEDAGGSGAMGTTYSAPRTGIPASMQSTSKLITTSDGRVVSVAHVIILRPEAGPVPLESKVTDALGNVYRVVASDPYPDSRRPSQWELMVETLGVA